MIHTPTKPYNSHPTAFCFGLKPVYMVDPDTPCRVSERDVNADLHAQAVTADLNTPETHVCADAAAAKEKDALHLTKSKKY